MENFIYQLKKLLNFITSSSSTTRVVDGIGGDAVTTTTTAPSVGIVTGGIGIAVVAVVAVAVVAAAVAVVICLFFVRRSVMCNFTLKHSSYSIVSNCFASIVSGCPFVPTNTVGYVLFSVMM